MSYIKKGNMTTHEWIEALRKDIGLEPGREDTEEEKRDRKARARRVEEAETEENYRKLFNRDYWTDEWLGPGPDPGLQYLEDDATPKQVAKRVEKEHREWKEKYMPEVPKVKWPEQPKESKAVKKARKKRKEREMTAEQQHRYDVAYWWLEEFLKPKYAQEIYQEYAGRFEEMVDYCVDIAESWAHYMTYEPEQRNIPPEVVSQKLAEEEALAKLGVKKDEDLGLTWYPYETFRSDKRYFECDLNKTKMPTIPDEYWDEFDKWADKHPLKRYKKKAKRLRVSAMALRRAKFLKKINKRNKGFRKNLMATDPITGMSFLSEKELKKYYSKQVQKFDTRSDEYLKEIDKWVEEGVLTVDQAEDLYRKSEAGRRAIANRYKQMAEIAKNMSKEDRDRQKAEKKAKDKIKQTWFKNFKDYVSKGSKKPYVFKVGDAEIKASFYETGARRPEDRNRLRIEKTGGLNSVVSTYGLDEIGPDMFDPIIDLGFRHV